MIGQETNSIVQMVTVCITTQHIVFRTVVTSTVVLTAIESLALCGGNSKHNLQKKKKGKKRGEKKVKNCFEKNKNA
jgi:hypothetical protein